MTKAHSADHPEKTGAGPHAHTLSRTSTITLNGPLSQVFPLFNPVRESDWAAGWAPRFLGGPPEEIAEHLVFHTHAPHGHAEPDYTWVLSKYAPEQGLIEYTVFTPERVWWITIQCAADGPAQTCAAITYTYAGLTAQGQVLNAQALHTMYADDLHDWERAINHYLATGDRLPHH